MERKDDLSIDGEILLWRRIPPNGDRVTWDQAGQPEASSFNFKDAEDELSLYIASETTTEQILNNHDGFGIVQIKASQLRELIKGGEFILCRDDRDPAHGHILLCGKVGGKLARKIRDKCEWVPGYLPAKQE